MTHVGALTTSVRTLTLLPSYNSKSYASVVPAKVPVAAVATNVASAFSRTASLIGDTGTGAVTFRVSPAGPAVASFDAGFAPLGETGMAVCRPHASDNASSADTPVTAYKFRDIQ